MVRSITNKKWKHFTDADGNTYKTALADGYQYGDRMLEDVYFEITIEDSGELNIKVEDSAKDYFSQLNEEYWLSSILEGVEKNREALIKVGKNSYDEVELVEADATSNTTTQTKTTPQPIVVKATSAQELIDKLNGKSNVTENAQDDEDEFSNYFNKDNEESGEVSDEENNFECVKTLAESFATGSSATGDKAYKEMALNATEQIFGERKLYPTRKNITDAEVTAYIKNLKSQLEQIDNMYTATMGMWDSLFANGTVQSPNGKAPQIMMGNQPLQRNPLVVKLKELLEGLLTEIEKVDTLDNTETSVMDGTVNNTPNNNATTSGATVINSAIQTMNNGKTNITANPATSDLGLGDDDVDPDFVTYSQKLDNLHTTIKEKASEKEEELKNLNKVIDRNTYWEVYYNLELYNTILNKFFDKEYLTHPKIRFAKVKTFLEEVTYKFTPYLESISYKIKSEEDIEAYEKEYLAKNLLTELFQSEKKKETPVTEKVDLKELGQNISDEKKSKLSDFLRKVEAGTDFEQEKENASKKELTEYEKANLKGKIALKYQEVLKRAIELDNEEDGLIKTYVETLYNPATTSLDDKNLLLNLLIVSRMQDFGVMKWDFDESRVKVSNTETNLKHDWWSKILKEDIEEDLKYTKIIEKELNLAFYTSFISMLLKNADKLSYGERNLKFKKILADGDEDTSRESLLLDTVLKKTHSGSILFITPDMEKWIQTENSVNEELGDKGQVKYQGVWNERHIFVINVDKIRGLEQYSNEVIFVNKGNSYVLNPEKPIAYFNVIDNPFLERPILKWFAGAEFDISMDKATRMRVDNTFLE
jgi:hypothetical protein